MKFVLWGTGMYGHRILAAKRLLEESIPDFVEREFQLVGVIDHATNRQGVMFGNCVVQAPEIIDDLPEDTMIVVAMQNSAPVLLELQGRGISEERIFTVQRFFRFFFCENVSAIREWQWKSASLSATSKQFLTWLYTVNKFVQIGEFSEKKALEYHLSHADIAGICDLALSEQEITQFYQNMDCVVRTRPLKTIAICYVRFHNGGGNASLRNRCRFYFLWGFESFCCLMSMMQHIHIHVRQGSQLLC